MLFDGKRILITGGTGTVGQELAAMLLGSYSPESIVIYSRSEVSQVLMKNRLDSSKLHFKVGDIRDIDALKDAFQGIDYVFHLAALKHVGICENQPSEAIKTNVAGTSNVIKAAIYNKVGVIVNLSSDKAVNPAGTYGHTKALAELMFIQAASAYPGRFINVRSGNIFGSSGSVVPLLIKQIRQGNVLKVTNPAMTRFFVSVREIVEYLLWVALSGDSGKTYITDNAQSFRLGELAEVIIEVYGDEDSRIEIIGTGGSPEKVHEDMFTEGMKVYILSQGAESYQATENRRSDECVVGKTYLKTWINGNFGY
jgi:FlaA1/EpsC-like NDP-sugar epimerase